MAFKKHYLKSKAVFKVTFKISKEQIHAADNVRLLGNFYQWEADNYIPAPISFVDTSVV